jgi:hypothetical protein
MFRRQLCYARRHAQNNNLTLHHRTTFAERSGIDHWQ